MGEIVFVFASSQDTLFSSDNTHNYSYSQINTCYMDSWWEKHFSLRYEHSRSNWPKKFYITKKQWEMLKSKYQIVQKELLRFFKKLNNTLLTKKSREWVVVIWNLDFLGKVALKNSNHVWASVKFVIWFYDFFITGLRKRSNKWANQPWKNKSNYCKRTKYKKVFYNLSNPGLFN